MEERFFSLQTTDVKKENRPVFGTFHGFFFSVLRSVENNGQKKVLPSAKKRMLLQEECIRLHIDQEDDSFWETLEHEISRIKSGLTSVPSSSILPPESFQLLFEAYEAALSANQLLDFDDILSQTLELLSLRKDILSSLQDHFSFFLIDEFQDVSQIQYSIMNLLAERDRNLFAVGECASIYHGANRLGGNSLLAAMYGIGLGPGDELICPSVTYWASCTSALGLGATVVFCDICEKDLQLDPASFEAHITPRTKAVMVVHYMAHPADMDGSWRSRGSTGSR